MRLGCIEYKGEWAVIDLNKFEWSRNGEGVIAVGATDGHAWCAACHKLNDRLESIKDVANGDA